MDLRKRDELLIKYVEQLDEENSIKLATELLNEGRNPLDILQLVNQGVTQVGMLYERKDYYIADLIMAGLIFKQVLDLDQMMAHFHNDQHQRIGKVVLGTVQGDIHDIGKDIFRGMLEANGFEVIDLGVDVPKEQFIKKAAEHRPNIIALSGVLTSTVDAMKEVVEALTEAGMRNTLKVITGGNHLTAEACNYIGADNFVTDASIGVRVCKEWVKCGEGMQGIRERGVSDHD